MTPDTELLTPATARSPYPLWALKPDGEELQVFNSNNTFTNEMRAFLTGSRN